MTQKKKQHYIPRFYLQSFVDPACPPDHEPYVWVYKRRHAVPKKRSPKNIAKYPYFYSFNTKNLGKDQVVEDLLSHVESNSAIIWNTLSDPIRFLSENERKTIAVFIACMYSRVPAIRSADDDFVNQLSKMILRMTATNYDKLDRDRQAEIELSRDELQKIADSKNIRFKSTQNIHIAAMLPLITKLYPLILKMNWAFLIAPREEVYITSDCPVNHLGLGFANPNAIVTFPVNRHLCMLLTWNGPTGYHRIDEHLVNKVNRSTAEVAHESIYTPKRLAWLDNL